MSLYNQICILLLMCCISIHAKSSKLPEIRHLDVVVNPKGLSTSWVYVVKASPQVKNIQLVQTKINERKVSLPLTFLPVRENYWQLAFEHPQTPAPSACDLGTNVTAEETEDNPIGKYFQELPKEYIDQGYSLLPSLNLHYVIGRRETSEVYFELFVEYHDLPEEKFTGASLRLWNLRCPNVVISDIDGTMTGFEYEDTLRGVVKRLGPKYSTASVHENLPELYNTIADDYGVQWVYISVRPFKKTEHTRYYLKHHNLPEGPIITVPYETVDSVHSFISNTAERLKMMFITELRSLGYQVVAGFGNRWSDHKVYTQSSVPEDMIFLHVYGQTVISNDSHYAFDQIPAIFEGAEQQRCPLKNKFVWNLFAAKNEAERAVAVAASVPFKVMGALKHNVADNKIEEYYLFVLGKIYSIL